MLEDKLTHDERLRLECIAQANMTYQTGVRPATNRDVVGLAALYEKFVRGEDDKE